MRNLLTTLAVICLGYPVVGDEAMNTNPIPITIETALPSPVVALFQWTEKTSLRGSKTLDLEDPLVASAKKQAWNWINKVLDRSWRPPANNMMLFIHDEFDDRDVVRIGWDHGGYRVEVSQTASIFALRIMSQGPDTAGETVQQRIEVARTLAQQVFNHEGRKWMQDAQGAGRSVIISSLKEKICESSFDAKQVKQLSADKVVIGTAKSKQNTGFRSSEYRSGSVAIDTPETTSDEWHYWFSNVNWWNDGNAVGFYFLKKDGPGAWIPSFVGNIDKNWFHGPRDRMGRPISTSSD